MEILLENVSEAKRERLLDCPWRSLNNLRFLNGENVLGFRLRLKLWKLMEITSVKEVGGKPLALKLILMTSS